MVTPPAEVMHGFRIDELAMVYWTVEFPPPIGKVIAQDLELALRLSEDAEIAWDRWLILSPQLQVH